MLQSLHPGTPTRTDNDQLFSTSRDQKNNVNYMFNSELNNFDTELKNIANSDNLNKIVNQNACCGGGVVYNNVSYLQHHGGPGYEHYPQGCDQLSYSYLAEYLAYDNCLQVKHKAYSDNVVIHIYNDKNKYSHTAVMYDNDVYCGEALRYQEYCQNTHNVKQYPMSFTNYGHYTDGQWAYVVYIHGESKDKVIGYYLYVQSMDGSFHTLTPYRYPIQGVLKIINTVTLHMALICKQNVGIQPTEDSSPRLVYENYRKDITAYEKYGCSCEDYITNIIDKMIQGDNTDIGNYQISRSDTNIKTLQNSLELDKDTCEHSSQRWYGQKFG